MSACQLSCINVSTYSCVDKSFEPRYQTTIWLFENLYCNWSFHIWSKYEIIKTKISANFMLLWVSIIWWVYMFIHTRPGNSKLLEESENIISIELLEQKLYLYNKFQVFSLFVSWNRMVWYCCLLLLLWLSVNAYSICLYVYICICCML
jgi:hypothetical protein